jgi:hypothetical protein
MQATIQLLLEKKEVEIETLRAQLQELSHRHSHTFAVSMTP